MTGRFLAAALAAVLVMLAGAMPAPAQQGAPVNVRAGAHATFTRLVFDFPRQVPYKVAKQGGLVTITFEAPVTLDIADINNAPPLFVGGIRTATGGGRTVAVVAVPPASTVRDFYAGTKVALDVREPSPWQDPARLPAQVSVPGAEAPAEQKAAAAPPAPAEQKPAAAPVPAPAASVPPVQTAPAKPAVAQQNLAAPAQPVQPAPAAPAAQEKPAAPAAATAAASGSAGGGSLNALLGGGAPAATPPAQAGKPGPARQLPKAETQSQAQGQAPAGGPLRLTPPAQQAGQALTPPPAAPAGAAATGAAATGAPTALGAPGTPDAAPGAQLSVAKDDADTVTLRFDWAEPVAAAVFRRGGYLWLVFDKRTNVNTTALQDAGAEAIKSLQQIYIPQATVLRMTTPKDVNPSMRRAGLAWLVDFRKQEPTPKIPLEIQAQTDSPAGARIFMPLPEPGKVIPLTDPSVGDNLLVVPGIPLGHGVAGTYAYPQFEVLPSIQGVVVAPRIDDVRVRAVRQGVEIASAAPTYPLKISPVSKELAASARMAAMRPLVRLLDLEKWDTPNDAAILQTRALLERNISTAPDAAKQGHRMDLARFYFANHFAAEALGVLNRAVAVDPKLVNDREFRVLRGGAQFLMGRMDLAEEDLYAPILNGNDEAEFWRALVQAEKGDMTGAAIELRRSGSLARAYPKPLRFRTATLVAEALVQIGDTRSAETMVTALQADNPGPLQSAKVKFVQGRLAELEGDFDGAVVLWEDIMDGPDRLARFRAARSRAELLLRLERIAKDEAIQDLEKQRFAWRGDDREFNLLRRLGDLYLETGKYRDALQTLRQAATHFREHPDAKTVTKLMSDTFNGLYLEDKADSLPPVTAIALYEEFKELTPAGARGDLMIQKLADRLVGVDLLEEAAKLLEGQIQFRLQGTDRARVGMRLALIHQLARKFADSERVLRATEAPNLPAELGQRRRHMLVQALAGQKKFADALALIVKDESMDAELLRAEINWTMNNWNDAAQALQRVVNQSGARRGKELDRKQARYLLNLATAMTLAGNERGLLRVRESFSAPMAQTEFGKAFELIAARPAIGLIAPDSVDDRVKEAQGFQTFLAGYREKLAKDPLSAIN